MTTKPTSNRNSDLAEALALFDDKKLSMADAAAINEIAYSLYSIVPHGKHDEAFFSIDNIHVYEDFVTKELKVKLRTAKNENDDLLPQPSKAGFHALSLSVMTAFLEDRPKQENETEASQKFLMEALQNKLATDAEFASKFNGHLQSLKDLQDRGFSLENYTYHSDSNHSAVTLWHEDTATAVFAHRGSAGDTKGLAKDWVQTDFGEIGLLGKMLTKADEAAIGYVNFQFDRVVKEHPNLKNIFETGHSKGGRESQNAAKFLEGKLNNYLAIREVAFEQQLTTVPAPKAIGLTALTFNSARVFKGDSRLKMLGERFKAAGVLLSNLVGKPMLMLDRWRAEKLQKKFAELKPADKNLMAQSVASIQREVVARAKLRSETSPVVLKHINISYADMQGKNADPVSNLQYGGGHWGRDIVIKHPNVEPILKLNNPVSAHSLKRTHELVNRSAEKPGTHTFDQLFSAMPVETLIDAVNNISKAEYQSCEKTFTVGQVNKHCIELQSKFNQRMDTVVEVSQEDAYAEMGTLDRLKSFREAKMGHARITEKDNDNRSSNDFGM